MKSYTRILIAELGQFRLIDPEKFDSRFASRGLGALLIGSENSDLSNEMSRPKPLADLLQADFPGENVKERSACAPFSNKTSPARWLTDFMNGCGFRRLRTGIPIDCGQ